MIQTEQAIHFSLEPKIVMIMGKNEIYFVQVSNIKKTPSAKDPPWNKPSIKHIIARTQFFPGIP